jgi:hypothetical protein
MKTNKTKMTNILVVGFVMMVLLSVSAIAAIDVTLSDQGTDVYVKSSNAVVNLGDLTVFVYDVENGSSPLYNETFVDVINNGSWNVMIGENSSNPLSLEFGQLYYKDYSINGEDVDYTNLTGNVTERLPFYSPLGDVNSSDIANDSITSAKILDGTIVDADISDSTNLTVAQKITFAFGEIIDNIIDGLVTVTGNLNVTGNVTVTEDLTVNEKIITNEIHARNTENLSFFNSTGQQIVHFADNGRVGIGRDNLRYADLEIGLQGVDSSLAVFSDTGRRVLLRWSGNDALLETTGSTSDLVLLPGGEANSTSNVGIGVLNPGSKLHVNGTFQANNTLYVNSDGNVGIGTTTPTHELSVIGNSNFTGSIHVGTAAEGARINVYGGANQGQLFAGSSGGLTATHLGSFSDTPLAFFANASSPRLVIDQDGNVGIGTHNPSNSLHVNSTGVPARLQRTSATTSTAINALVLEQVSTGDAADGFGSRIEFQIEDTGVSNSEIASISAYRDGADNSGALSFRTNNAGTATGQLVMLSNGNVGINTSSPAATLHVAGELRVDNTTKSRITVDSGANEDAVLALAETITNGEVFDGAKIFHNGTSNTLAIHGFENAVDQGGIDIDRTN